MSDEVKRKALKQSQKVSVWISIRNAWKTGQ